MPCPIGNTGWSFSLELFYNPDYVRRFGADLFGDDLFGNYAADPGSVSRWVDLTAYVANISFTRGLTVPDVNVSTDSLEFVLLDNQETSLVGWLPPKSLASPNIHTPIRLSLIEPDDTVNIVLTARIDTMAELHGGATREILFQAFGTKTELRTLVLPQIFASATAAARIDDVLAQIGFTDPVSPYPPEFTATTLLRDPAERATADELDAYNIVQQCALSCGYSVVTASDGTLAWSDLRSSTHVPVASFIDCADTDDQPGPAWYEIELTNAAGEGNELVNAAGQILIDYGNWPVSTRQLWQSDTEEVLNVVQVLSVDPALSAEAIDATSVQRWGRQNSGFGFPILTANKDRADGQALADAILVTTANRVNRVSEVEFHTLTDPGWLDILAYLEIDGDYTVIRTQPELAEMPFRTIGYTVTVTGTHIEGVIHGITTYQTL